MSVPVPISKGEYEMIKVVNLRKIVVFVVIFVIFFIILYYKNFLFGNNISKNRVDKKIENILQNMNNYNAEIEVTVSSNKTENKYKMYQEVENNHSMQEISDGENEGMKIELNDGILKISNAKLNLEKVYENYEETLNNSLFLNSFANDYSDEENNSKSAEENDEIVLEVELKKNTNTYIKYKKLYLDKNTLNPKKLEVKGTTKKETICIIYNSVELN